MIRLNYLSIIVPIHKLNRVYPGGFKQYKKDFPNRIESALRLGGLDDDLLCISVMNPMDASLIAATLESYGLDEAEQVGDRKVHKDFCICDILNGCEYQCTWLAIYGGLAVYLHKRDSYHKAINDLCQTFRQEQAQAQKGIFNAQLKEISVALNSPMEINNELNERNLFFGDEITGQECEVVKSTFVGKERADALWREMVPVYEKLAKEGNGEAYNLLGIIFQEKKELADQYFRFGMENGSACAAFNLAIRTEDKKEKFALYLWASKHIMNPDEQDDSFRGILFENLAKMYHLGIGTQPDRNEAERYYQAAIANHAKAKAVKDNFIALLFENGKRMEAIQQIIQFKEATRKMKGGLRQYRIEGNQARIYYREASEQTVRLSLITDFYIDCIIYVEEHKETDNWDGLLRGLPDLILDERFVLDAFRPCEETNSVLGLYARKRSHPHPQDNHRISEASFDPLDIFRFISLPFTAEAIWQAFLLSQTFRLTGMRWHGGYARRTFLLLEKDIANIQHPGYNLNEEIVPVRNEISRIWSPDLNVSVTLHDDFASISHCWFDAWKGLVQMNWKVKYDAKKKQITEIEKIDEKVLVKYHCEMCY